MRLLEALGYQVTRSAASLGEWDLVGVGATDFVLVQVRSNQWPSMIERLALTEFRCPENTKKLIHRWRDGARTPDVMEL